MSKHVQTIGVLTSGGDAPGMNAAMRAVVREALFKGLKVKGISRGYAGLLNEDIFDMTASDVSETISKGGTFAHPSRGDRLRRGILYREYAGFLRRKGKGQDLCRIRLW